MDIVGALSLSKHQSASCAAIVIGRQRLKLSAASPPSADMIALNISICGETETGLDVTVGVSMVTGKSVEIEPIAIEATLIEAMVVCAIAVSTFIFRGYENPSP